MALALVAASLLSCVKDEERIFEDSASARITKYLAEAQKTLVDAPNGWIMFYYPNGPGEKSGTQMIGGYVYTMTFTNEEVTVWSELFDHPSTSLYSMVKDDGPVLNFDAFNENLYYFATPAGSAGNIYGLKGEMYYMAHKGDIGFNILSYSPDQIVLRGKRSRNYYMMYPVPSSTTPEEYAKSAALMAEEFGISTFEGQFAGKDALFLIDLAKRQIDLQFGSGSGESFEMQDEFKTSFAYTPDGIKLYKAISYNGAEFDELTWNSEDVTLSWGSYVLNGSLPPYWQEYDLFLGDYTLYYYATAADYTNKKVSSFDISITPNVNRKSFWVTGVVQGHDLIANYDLSTGTINLNCQVVGTEPGYYYQFSANNTPAGKVSYDDTVGMQGRWEVDSNPFTVNFADNGAWSYEVTGFIMYQFTNAGSRVGRMETGEWSFNSGSGYLRYLTKIVKK